MKKDNVCFGSSIPTPARNSARKVSHEAATAFFSFFFLLLGGACASVPMASAEMDTAAKSFPSPPSDRAFLYIYRNQSIGSLIKMDLAVDGSLVGTTTSRTYLFLSLPPGDHTIASKSIAPPGQGPDPHEPVSTLRIHMQGAQTYFVWQEVESGASHAQSELHLAAQQEGRGAVGDCALIAPPAPRSRKSPGSGVGASLIDD
jgi:Protein of unknown function (DUF2846)